MEEINFIFFILDGFLQFRKPCYRQRGFFIGAGIGLILLIAAIIAFVVVITSREYFIMNSTLSVLNIYLK